jgi:hypothetical protein
MSKENLNINGNVATNSPNPMADKTMTENTRFIDLAKIQSRDNFRSREQGDVDTIDEYTEIFTDYKEALERGENPQYPFPAICVWQDAEKLVQITGFIRSDAARRAKLDQILVEEFFGTEDDAFMLAMKDNMKHGLKLSPGDKKFCITKAILRFPETTAGTIAKELGCGRSYVYRIKADVSPGVHVDGEKKLGADGKMYSAKKVESPAMDNSPDRAIHSDEESEQHNAGESAPDKTELNDDVRPLPDLFTTMWHEVDKIKDSPRRFLTLSHEILSQDECAEKEEKLGWLAEMLEAIDNHYRTLGEDIAVLKAMLPHSNDKDC